MKAIIPTGGRGTRMRPLTFSANKHFIPVANKPLIYYPIETVANAGIKEVLITYNPESLNQAKQFLGDGSQWGLNFTYVLQESPKGLANIFQVCEEQLAGENFVLHLGDNIFADGINELVDHFEKEKPNGLVAMVHHKENRRLGVPYFDDNGRLIKYVEKPEHPPHDFAIPGIYFFDNIVFKCFKEDPIKPSARGELEIPAPFQWLIDHGYRVDVLEYKGKWLDPGKFDDWIAANEYLLEQLTEARIDSEFAKTVEVEGKVSIGQNCQIDNAYLKGPLIIGDQVVIKDSFIGPYSSISNDCQIIKSQIKNSVLMPGVKLTKLKKCLDASLVGTESEISGNGPDTMNLFIGEKCQIKI